MARIEHDELAEMPWIDLTSGHVRRAVGWPPKQGAPGSWKLNQRYLHDIGALRFGGIEDGVLRLEAAGNGPRRRAVVRRSLRTAHLIEPRAHPSMTCSKDDLLEGWTGRLKKHPITRGMQCVPCMR